MNIWIFNHYAVGPNSSGGTRHFDLAKELVKKGHSVTVFASSFNHQMLREEHISSAKQGSKELTYEGVKFTWIKTFPYKRNNYKRVLNMLSYSFRALRIAKNKPDKPDIIIGSLVHPIAAYIGYLVSKHYNCIFYFEERDLWPQTLIDLGKMSNKNPIIYMLEKIETFLFKKAKRVIVLFDKAVDYVESKGIKRDKVLYIPNGLDISRTKSNAKLPVELNNLLKKLANKTIAVYTGAHGKANNLDIILNSAQKLNNKQIGVAFVLIGNGPEKERLKQRVRNEDIANVYFLDPIDKELIPSLLKKTDVGLLPLSDSPVFKWGISPNKLFDYMGASLPVLLLCNLDDTPVELANGGEVIKTNFEEGIINFFSNENKGSLKKYGMNSKEYVEKNHSWEKLANVLEQKMIEDLQ